VSGWGFMLFSDIQLAVVCPMANEIETAVRFVDDVVLVCRRYNFRSVTFLAVLDNVSKDGTLDVLRSHVATCPELRVVWAPENRCVVDAYMRGYSEALSAEADWILEIDAGFSHQPADIPQFFSRMAEGYDCVFGSRFIKGGDISDNPLKRKLISKVGTVLSNALLRTQLHDMTSGFQLFSRAAIEGILARGIRSRGPFFQTEMKVYSHKLRIVEVPIRYRGASHSVGRAVLADSLKNLWHLYQLRLQGQL
jgi:dolichol-phosphate mannosyltransferase